MLFQDAGSALFPWLTVEENIRFGLNLKDIKRQARDSVSTKYLAMVGLNDHREKFPSQLSGGMQQRVQIARALAVEPAILLMDEPFAALDALTRRRMHTELLKIWQSTQTTIIFVTHDISEAIALADRIAIMNVGPRSRIKELIEIDMPRPRSPATAEFGAMFNRVEMMLTDADSERRADHG